jgi:hypothetical protein
LYEADAGWEVWIDWYNERLNGSPTDADLEIDRVLKVDEETWKSDPKTINSRIKEIIAQFKTQQEKKPLQNIDDVGPPKKPLPDASPATRFVYTHGKFDVVPPSAWAGREGQAAVYHAKALKLATELSQRLLNTDAVPDVAGSVQALADVLGGSITDLQPDQLRLATRSIAARARVYGHQSAEWEISVESVSKLFELSDVLVDIQSFVRVDLDRHEAAIRQLDLDPQSASELKKGLDKLSVAIAESDFVSDKASAAFDLGTEISGSASDQGAKIAIEGDRSLMVGNLALAVARELSRDPVESPTKSEGGSGPSPPKGPSKSGKEDEPRPRRTRARKTGPAPERSWENFSERVVQQVHDKGAEKIGDALVAAAVSAIKYAPATVSGVGATLALWASQYPALATGSVSTTMAWIGYQVWRSQKK